MVDDPTGTPLNVRTRPYGAILGALNNGTRVLTFADETDVHGEVWSRIATVDRGKDGWVYRKYLDCSD